MVRRARVVATDSAAQEGVSEDQIAADSAPVADGEETPSSSFSVIDRRGDDYVPPSDEALGHIEIIEGEPKRRTRRPRNVVPKATSNEIAQAAPLLVGLSNQVVVTWMGPECAMLEQEARFITPSVARILSRLPRGAAEQVSLYTDPFIVLTALGLWAARIARIKEMQAKQAYQVTPFEAARAYGESGTNLGEVSEPIGQQPMSTEVVSPPDAARANGATSTIMQGRNPV